MTIKVVDADTMQPISAAHVKSMWVGRVLDIRGEPSWVDGQTDRNGCLTANVPVEASTVIVYAAGYEHLIVQHYMEKTPPTGVVLAEMKKPVNEKTN